VVVGIETDRGPWVEALIAAGYQAFAINPMAATRYPPRRLRGHRQPITRALASLMSQADIR